MRDTIRIEFELPIRLVSEANAHEHWRRRQKRAREQRSFAAIILRPSLYLIQDDVRHGVETGLVVTITRIAPRALDSDNAVGAAKHVRDGVADALGINDRDPRVEWIVKQRKGEPKEYAVEILIEGRA